MATTAKPPRARRLNNDALGKDAIDKLNTEKKEKQSEDKADGAGLTEPESEPEPTATITKAQFDKLMGAMSANADAAARVPVLEKELADAKAELEAKEAEIQAAADKAKTESEVKDDELNFLDGLFKTMGYPNPAEAKDRFNPNTIVTGAKMDAATAVREFEAVHKDSQGGYRNYDSGSFEVLDSVKIDRFVREHREEVRDGMEALAKKSGLLQGNRSDAATAATNIPVAYLTYMSSMMRMQHSPNFIYWQFADTRIDTGKGMGDSILIPRTAYGETGTTTADWELAAATPITTDRQPLGISTVPATLREYGMGKNTTIRPIAIPEFITETSQIALEQIVMKNLGYNYTQYEEIAARSLWFSSTKTAYNNGGNVVQTPASVAATAATAKYRSGALSYQFLINLYAFLSGQQIPAYLNGCYGLTLHENALAQLKSSLAEKNQYLNPGDCAELTNTFRASTMNPNLNRISGYQGTIANFMIFSTNNHSLGAAGTIGAQNETVGGVSQITRTSFAFGANSIGRGTAMAAQIRQQVDIDFGRMGAWMWKSHEAWAQLDVDAAVAGQQTRVFKINTTDAEV